MRNAAFEGNMLRLLRREIQYELQSSPPNQVFPFPHTKCNASYLTVFEFFPFFFKKKNVSVIRVCVVMGFD